MRLSKVKLAGFKSFVEPTTFVLPSNLNGIVGPNGCGKSNIIDAVRWVMGESSAKQLRGEAMADVIFNGAVGRKPSGQASIELIFDNSAGLLGGQWAAFAEISVRRLLNRDGQSSYHLNGVRCRRKDITDLFLGTGLGSRSYAIIEQGMISRVVESRPEDLRVFFEEAAGISKYKERRRETQSHMAQTRDNLLRLTDIHEELVKQHISLAKQAKVAEQYQVLKQQARDIHIRLLQTKLASQQLACEQVTQYITEQQSCEAAMVTQANDLKHTQHDLSETMRSHSEQGHALQAALYQTNAAIARLEQHIHHNQTLIERVTTEQQEGAIQLTRLAQLSEQETSSLEELAMQCMQNRELHAYVTSQFEVVTQSEHGLQHAHQLAQQQWEQLSHDLAQTERDMSVLNQHIVHLESSQLEAQRRLSRLTLDTPTLSTDIAELAQQSVIAQAVYDTCIERVQEEEQKLLTLHHREVESQTEQQQIQAELHLLAGQRSALITLEQAASMHLPDAKAQLVGHIKAKPEWERAVEVTLGAYLTAEVCQNWPASLPAHALWIADRPSSSIDALDMSLAAQVQAPWALTSLLQGARIVPDLQSAYMQRGQLAKDEFFITPEGHRLFSYGFCPNQLPDHATGRLARQRALQAATEKQVLLDAQTNAVAAQIAELKLQIQLVKQQLNDEQRAEKSAQHAHQQALQNLALAEQQFEIQQHRVRDIALEKAEINQKQVLEQEQIAMYRMQLESLLVALQDYTDQRDELKMLREQQQIQLEQVRLQSKQAQTEVQSVDVQFAQLHAQQQASQATCLRYQQEQDELRKRLQMLETEASSLVDPEQQIAQLQFEQQQHITLGEQMRKRELVEQELRQHIKKIDDEKSDLDQKMINLTTQLQHSVLQQHEYQIRAEALLEQLAALLEPDQTLVEAVSMLEDEQQLSLLLAEIEAKLTRIGAVNLTAIEAYTEVDARKQDLETQIADIELALETLTAAIRTIDQETRGRFVDTFNKVNLVFSTLFPRLFGGGEARLELTSDNPLECGVSIIAKPPGKRPSTIHLLSGGEKALTAVALVFGIFELNPAPFCLLDEVDAPLDEANVGRFAALLKEMSQRVQLIFITHNKGTMAVADHLIGVTMSEPGVSRLVSVDMAAALDIGRQEGEVND